MLRAVVLMLVALWAGSLVVLAANAEPEELKCEIGPVTKTYGKTQWQVYSCNDERSLVIVSAPGNPASPFFFRLTPGTDGYDVYGEGAGDKTASDAAAKDIRMLSRADIAALIAETKAKPK